MDRTLPPICLLDPLSLVGRELLRLLERRRARVAYRHTLAGDEHQVAELGGQAELVPPLGEPEDVPGDAVLVLTAEPAPGRREILEELLEQRPGLPVLDLSPTAVLTGPTVAAGPLPAPPDPPRVRVASPVAAALHHLSGPLRELGLAGLTAVVEVPASASGTEWIERLAGQAAARLAGRPPEPLPDGTVLAFNLVTGTDPALAAEVAQLLPGVPAAVTVARPGTFHGWAVHLGAAFSRPVDTGSVVAAWRASGRIEVVSGRLELGAATERDEVLVSPPSLSADGRFLVTVAALDGLRVGCAATALEILPTLL